MGEKGWGEFDMTIILTPVGAPKGGDQTIQHDLNFQQEEYESTHSVTFRNPKDQLLQVLKESAPANEAVNGATGRKAGEEAPEDEQERRHGEAGRSAPAAR